MNRFRTFSKNFYGSDIRKDMNEYTSGESGFPQWPFFFVPEKYTTHNICFKRKRKKKRIEGRRIMKMICGQEYEPY